MSAEFVDTNVLVYAHDPTDRDKHAKARALLERLWQSGEGTLSVQVLQEFFWVITRKVPKPIDTAKAIDILEDFAAWNVVAPRATDVIQAARLGARRRISFWDAMVVQTALLAGASILWSEDLSDTSDFGSLVVRNPFAA